MTEKQRNLGRLITIGVLVGVLLAGVLSSCTPLIYKSNQIKVTHVLAVTEAGDTVKISMRDIQPTRIYNVVGYDFVRGYNNPYYDPWRQYHMYDNSYRYFGNVGINSGIHMNKQNTWTPPVVITGNNSSKTTGGGGNPVAVNPVTIGGGKKKNN